MQGPGRLPNDPRPLISKAVQHQKNGEYAQAERIYTEILKASPDNADVNNLMGLLAHQTGRHELAERHMQRALQLSPRRAEFHYNYGAMSRELGRPDQAAREFQVAVELAPQMADAWQGLAFAFLDMKLEMYAVACLQQLLQLQPRRADLWQTLGECLESIGMMPEAAAAMQHARQLAPDDPRTELGIVRIAVESGDDAAAHAGFERLPAAISDTPEARYQKGVWLANKGDFDAARAELDRALELSPDFSQAALYYSYITELSLDHPLVSRLMRAAQRHEWDDNGEGANVNFALGYVLDQHKQYDAAFAHYAEANRLRRVGARYSTASHREHQASMLQNLGSAFQARAQTFGNPSQKPLFIVGLPRSGTSLLEQVLSGHPEIYGGGEMVFLHAELRRRLGPAGYGDLARSLASLGDAALADLAATVLAHMERLAPGKARITDKMPSNLTILGLIHGLFPAAHIIYCQRDPLDTCVSCFTTSFKSGHKFSNDLTELGEYYRISEAAMQRWEEIFTPGSVCRVRYEDLVTDLEGETRRLLAFCGLEWHPGCLDFRSNARAVKTASVYQVRQPIYGSAIGRWRRYESHLAPLQQALAAPPLL